MMHASTRCGLFPRMSPDIPRNRLTVSMLQLELSTVLALHFSVARCIVLIMANTSLVSETLLAISMPFSLMYIHVHVHAAIMHSHLFLWHIAVP